MQKKYVEKIRSFELDSFCVASGFADIVRLNGATSVSHGERSPRFISDEHPRRLADYPAATLLLSCAALKSHFVHELGAQYAEDITAHLSHRNAIEIQVAIANGWRNLNIFLDGGCRASPLLGVMC